MQPQAEIARYAEDSMWQRDLARVAHICREDWRNHPVLARWLPLLADSIACADMGDAYQAALLATPIVEDQRLARGFLKHWLAPLKSHPLMVTDLAVHLGADSVSAVLYRKGPLTLSLVSLGAHSSAESRVHTIGFTPGASIFAPVNGVPVTVQRWRETGARAQRKAEVAGQPETVLHKAMAVDTDCHSVQLLDTPKAAVLLRLTIAAPNAAGLTQRYYTAENGALLRTNCADPLAARNMLALSALRAMGRGDALPDMLAMSRQPLASLRWQALRECLATDMAGTLPLLREYAASDPDPQICAMAKALVLQVEQRLAASKRSISSHQDAA